MTGIKFRTGIVLAMSNTDNTNTQTSNTQQAFNARQAADQARQANQEAEAARRQVQDLQNTIKNTTTPGDPSTATTGQLITGDY